MKNWVLEQFLYTVRQDYDFGNDKFSSFSRSYPGKEPKYIFRSHYDIISMAIKYIEELERKVDELSYAQKIIDEVRTQDGRTKARTLDPCQQAAR
jgi:hypothetical protein